MDDKRTFLLEGWVGRLLRLGVCACGAVIAWGWVETFWIHGNWKMGNSAVLSQLMQGRELSGKPVPTSLSEFYSALQTWEPRWIISIGLILLVLLPICRVALTGLIFLIQKDFFFAFLSSVVLLILVAGLFS